MVLIVFQYKKKRFYFAFYAKDLKSCFLYNKLLKNINHSKEFRGIVLLKRLFNQRLRLLDLI